MRDLTNRTLLTELKDHIAARQRGVAKRAREHAMELLNWNGKAPLAPPEVPVPTEEVPVDAAYAQVLLLHCMALTEASAQQGGHHSHPYCADCTAACRECRRSCATHGIYTTP